MLRYELMALSDKDASGQLSAREVRFFRCFFPIGLLADWPGFFKACLRMGWLKKGIEEWVPNEGFVVICDVEDGGYYIWGPQDCEGALVTEAALAREAY